MYRALLHQILSRQRKIVGAVMRSNASTRIGRAEQDSHHHSDPGYRGLLLDALRRVCQLSEPTTIFIDAVDECVDGDRGSWDTFFHDILMSDDFKTLHVCLSSRHFGVSRWLWLRPPNAGEPNDTISSLQSPVIEVEVENQSAIRAYLDERLRVYSSETETLVEIKEKIQAMSSGVFLWVEAIVDRLIDELRGHKSGHLELQLKPTPKRLKKLYDDILSKADDPMKTYRFFQWLFMAPDLSIRAWRDLIPFLQDKPPRSIKHSRRSEDWAEGSTASDQDDAWIPNFQQIVCRICLGLAHVAMVSETNLEKPAGDQHSVAGEAGSWNTGDGDKRFVRPVHASLKQFLQDEGGFDALRVILGDHHDEGLMMAMKTCLDFIKAREFSRLGLTFGGNKNDSESQMSTVSLLSDGDISAHTNISRFSSARSSQHNADHHRPGEILSYSSIGSSSTEDIMLGDKGIEMGAVLARLNREAIHCSETSHEKRSRIERWRDSAKASQLVIRKRSPSIPPIRTPSTRSRRWENWSSELLSYLLTAFPEFARSAEKSGIDSRRIIVRLRDDGLWEHWLHLSDHIATDTTLKQWAESQQLHTWVAYLSRTQKPSTFPSDLGVKKPGYQNRADHEMNLNYCFDGGDHFVKQADTFSRTHSAFPSFRHATADFSLESLEDQLSQAISISEWPPDTLNDYNFIPYKSLRRILTETVVAELLRRETKLSLKKAREIRESSIKVLATLILIDHASNIEQLYEAGINDACLPLKDDRGSKSTGHLVCDIPGKDTSVLRVLNSDELLFEDKQWLFLSPFLARPAGQLQHYRFRSSRYPMPIISHGPYLRWRQQDVKIVCLHLESFDFEDNVSLPHRIRLN